MAKLDKPFATYRLFLDRLCESDLSSNARITGVALLRKCNIEGWEQPFLMSERSLRHDTGIMKRLELLRSLRQLSEQKFICHSGDYYVLNLAPTQKEFLAFSYPDWEHNGDNPKEPKTPNGTSKKGKRKTDGGISEESKSVNNSYSGDYLFDQIAVTQTSTAKIAVAAPPDATRHDSTRPDYIRHDLSPTRAQNQEKPTKKDSEKIEREREGDTKNETEEEKTSIDNAITNTTIKDTKHNRRRLLELCRKHGIPAFDLAVKTTVDNNGKSVEYIAAVLRNASNDQELPAPAAQNSAKEGICLYDHQHNTSGSDHSADRKDESEGQVDGIDSEGYAIDGGPLDFTSERLAQIDDFNLIPDPAVNFGALVPMPRRFKGRPGTEWTEYCHAISRRRNYLLDAHQHKS